MEAKHSVAPRRSSTGLWVMVILMALVLLFSFTVNIGLATALFFKGSARTADSDGGMDEFPDLTEHWSYGNGEVKAVRIAVEGIILREANGDRLLHPPEDKIEAILRQIRAARNDEDVKAIILEVDSPGGGVTASDEIYSALNDFRDSAEDRKVVVFMRDLAASGGYYVAMAGDWLIAEPTTIVGSIGVIMQSLNWKTLSEKIGIKDVTIKSGQNKDLLNPFLDTPPEQLQILQEMIDNTYQRFFDIVRDGRGLEVDILKPLADGRIFDASKALELKLVDEIGYFEDAVYRTAELLGVEQVKVVKYEDRVDFWSILSEIRLPIRLPTAAEFARPRMMYLWQP